MSNIVYKYRVWRSRYWRMQRILFPSPPEIRFIEIMGGRVWVVPYIKRRNGFKLAFVLSLGKVLRRQHFKREVRYHKYFVDFSNDLNRIIEIDGAAYHMDVVADMEREMDIKGRFTDARFLRIPAYRVYNDSARVQQSVLAFIE